MAPRVLVTGAGGFVGRRVVAELKSRGFGVAGIRGRADADLGDPACVERVAERADAVIHLVGIVRPEGGNTFERAHVAAARHAVAIARRIGAARFVHMSAIGARADAADEYRRTKAAGEEIVRSSGLDWTILRCSMIFGEEGPALRTLAKLARLPVAVPMVAGSRFVQPVHVGDVARVFVDAVERREAVGRVFPVAGPRAYRWSEVIDRLAGARRLNIPVPVAFAAWFDPAARLLGEDSIAEMQETVRVFGGTWVEFGAWAIQETRSTRAPRP